MEKDNQMPHFATHCISVVYPRMGVFGGFRVMVREARSKKATLVRMRSFEGCFTHFLTFYTVSNLLINCKSN